MTSDVHEVRLEMPGRRAHALLKWSDGNLGPRGTFWLEGRRLTLCVSITRSRNGESFVEEAVDAVDLPCRALLDDLGPGPWHLQPKSARAGLGRLFSSSTPSSEESSCWTLVGGHGATATIYNSVICSHRKLLLELDLDHGIVWYFEDHDLDDG